MSRRNNIPCDNITRVWRTGTPPPHLSCTLAGHLELTSANSASDQWDMSIVSQRVAWLCAPYTYSSIAEPLRMNAETVRRMVRGLQQPSSEMLIRLCIYGRVSPNWLIFGILPAWLVEDEIARVSVREASTRRLILEFARRHSGLLDGVGS